MINNTQQYPLETSSKLANLLGTSIHKMAVGQFKTSATDFWVTENCNACSSCVQLCPRDNIKLVDQQPSWKQDCEACFGCIQLCPQQAIEYQDLSQGKSRSHHSEISLEDMIN